MQSLTLFQSFQFDDFVEVGRDALAGVTGLTNDVSILLAETPPDEKYVTIPMETFATDIASDPELVKAVRDYIKIGGYTLEEARRSSERRDGRVI